MKKIHIIMMAVMITALMFCGFSQKGYAAEIAETETETETGETVLNGFVSEDGSTYYYVDGVKQTGWQTIDDAKYYFTSKGKMVTGWKTIDDLKYYFNSKGKLQTNKIVGSKKKGYYYVDETGVRVTDSNIQAAVDFVMENSDSSQSASKRLKACFKALCKYPYKRFYSDSPSASKIKKYASYMFTNKTGNCYRYASAMAYIAKVLGYESRVAVGGVTAYSGSLSPHGWCEVKVNGKWKMIDCSMQRAHSDVSLYLVTRAKYPYRLRCDSVYTMTVKKGKVKWS